MGVPRVTSVKMEPSDAVDFVAQVEPALGRPGKLAVGDAAAVELRAPAARCPRPCVFSWCTRRGAPGHHLDDLVAPCRRSSGPPRCSGSRGRSWRRRRSSRRPRNAGCAARCATRASAPRARARCRPRSIDLARLHHRGREHFGFGVAVHARRTCARPPHGLASRAVARQRLGADLVALALGQRQRDGQVLLVGQRDDEQVDVVARDHRREVWSQCSGMLHVLREGVRALRRSASS